MLPLPFNVTTLALNSKIPFVFVIFLVTGQTIGLQLILEQIALVAAGTLYFAVLPAQRVFGFLAVIEDDFFPLFFNVAGLTLGTKAALVFVVFLMARIALCRRILELLISMALRTFHFDMLTEQFEMSLVVIEPGSLPVFFLMALDTVRAQSTFVFIIFLVAGITD